MSEQFVIETYLKLHPKSKKRNYDDLSEADIKEVADLVARRHAIDIGPQEQSWGVTLDMKILRDIMTNASITVRKGRQEQLDESIQTILGQDRESFDKQAMSDWLANFKYWDDMMTAIEAIEKHVLERLRDKTHEPDFYVG